MIRASGFETPVAATRSNLPHPLPERRLQRRPHRRPDRFAGGDPDAGHLRADDARRIEGEGERGLGHLQTQHAVPLAQVLAEEFQRGPGGVDLDDEVAGRLLLVVGARDQAMAGLGVDADALDGEGDRFGFGGGLSAGQTACP